MSRQYKIDALGDCCPIPVLKVNEVLPLLQGDDEIELLTDHSCTAVVMQEDFHGKRAQVSIEEIDNGVWRIVLRRLVKA